MQIKCKGHVHHITSKETCWGLKIEVLVKMSELEAALIRGKGIKNAKYRNLSQKIAIVVWALACAKYKCLIIVMQSCETRCKIHVGSLTVVFQFSMKTVMVCCAIHNDAWRIALPYQTCTWKFWGKNLIIIWGIY